ncbi:hypothetical protein CEXT_609141 [Caerostris extrusa]|uniref:Uncharacterized protein n=1 Tax=Caerostris extrusa TaxID=172846 RepID=A0AAV4PG13_CAEEX|nr:hypothetical protein CEXT_609141 [Caerostris extrusa]
MAFRTDSVRSARESGGWSNIGGSTLHYPEPQPLQPFKLRSRELTASGQPENPAAGQTLEAPLSTPPLSRTQPLQPFKLRSGGDAVIHA